MLLSPCKCFLYWFISWPVAKKLAVNPVKCRSCTLGNTLLIISVISITRSRCIVLGNMESDLIIAPLPSNPHQLLISEHMSEVICCNSMVTGWCGCLLLPHPLITASHLQTLIVCYCPYHDDLHAQLACAGKNNTCMYTCTCTLCSRVVSDHT